MSEGGVAAGPPQVPDRSAEHEQVSLARRLRDPRTIISIVVPLALLVLIAFNLRDFDLAETVATIVAANPLLLLGAFAIYYLGFPLRGYRWQLLLRVANTRIGLRDSTEIIFISWLVNCVVPAKLGDVYRAYLLRLNFAVSLSRTFGTVFIERIFDLFAIAILGLAAALWSFRDRLPPEVQLVIGMGIAVLLMLSAGLYTLRNFGRRTLVRLPLPAKAKLLEFYDRFDEGVFALRPRQVPYIALLTGLIWATEAMRLLLVIEALGFRDVHLGISGAFFVALAASLLTAIPFTPAGLGVVELGVVGILTIIYGVDPSNAVAITLVDRAISVLSIIAFGSVVYVLSGKTKPRARPLPADSG
ncbi:MAG TPA: lysylphosphatidylglycerol synthase transmembrane domain-containing protein [Candidatus Limnocylindria bacterium]|jgi:glycosyltransferase 2 family protein|nr:lysylphosphatidylglycerol synthase transmembrane domain-containing protein [Candidatus Limnocylindria bacterium]